MPVYGVEFVGDSWKHNCIFLWHCWILFSCCCLIIGLDISQTITPRVGPVGGGHNYGLVNNNYNNGSTYCRENCCVNNTQNNVMAHLVFNGVAVLFFNLFKIVGLFMGLCDTEYMANGFQELGSVKFAFSLLVTFLSLTVDIVFQDVLTKMKFFGVFVQCNGRQNLDNWSPVPAYLYLALNYAFHGVYVVAMIGAYCSGEARENRRKKRRRVIRSAQVLPNHVTTLSDLDELPDLEFASPRYRRASRKISLVATSTGAQRRGGDFEAGDIDHLGVGTSGARHHHLEGSSSFGSGNTNRTRNLMDQHSVTGSSSSKLNGLTQHQHPLPSARNKIGTSSSSTAPAFETANTRRSSSKNSVSHHALSSSSRNSRPSRTSINIKRSARTTGGAARTSSRGLLHSGSYSSYPEQTTEQVNGLSEKRESTVRGYHENIVPFAEPDQVDTKLHLQTTQGFRPKRPRKPPAAPPSLMPTPTGDGAARARSSKSGGTVI
ncbi:unnamed protein product [Amoebophrya sp. A120]|nr:unnamed protein product [Amoebophrya sp. A120]|eukprot:GSA120T00018988001.1